MFPVCKWLPMKACKLIKIWNQWSSAFIFTVGKNNHDLADLAKKVS